MLNHTKLLLCLFIMGALLLSGCNGTHPTGGSPSNGTQPQDTTPPTPNQTPPTTPPQQPPIPNQTIPPTPKGVCGDGVTTGPSQDGVEECDIGGKGVALIKDICSEGKSCRDCKCVSGVVTDRCGDGYISRNEECDVGGTVYAPDRNNDSIPDRYPDPCALPTECLSCKCQTPAAEAVINCLGDDTPPELVGRYTFIKGVNTDFDQRKWADWGDNWCAPTSTSYSLRYWFGRGYAKFLDQYRDNATKRESADEDDNGVVTDGEATEEMAQELGKNYMGTDPDAGTSVEDFVTGLERFINDTGYQESFVIKKYGTIFGNASSPTFNDYRKELEACEDVLFSIRYPDGGGHLLVGKGLNKDPNPDGSHNVSFLDPWTGTDYHTKMWQNGTIEYDGQNVTMGIVVAVSPKTPTKTYCGDRSLQMPNDDGVMEECETGVNICFDRFACDYTTCKCEPIHTPTYCGDGTVQKPNDAGVNEECEKNLDCGSGMQCNLELCVCSPKCGDGVCISGEGYSTCPQDCPRPIVCGDGVKAGNEQCETNFPCSEPQVCNLETCRCYYPDADKDGYPDYTDNCVNTPNDQTDLDGDGIGDPCDPVPVNCQEICRQNQYSEVVGEDITQPACQQFRSVEPITCKSTCTYIYYKSWNWIVSDYSCCCRQINYLDCTDCPGQNPQCPNCPETYP